MSEGPSDELGPWKPVVEWFQKLPAETGQRFVKDFLRAYELASERAVREKRPLMITVEFVTDIESLAEGEPLYLQFVIRPVSRLRLSKETIMACIGPSPTGKPMDEPLSMRHNDSCPFPEARGNCDCSPELLYPGLGGAH